MHLKQLYAIIALLIKTQQTSNRKEVIYLNYMLLNDTVKQSGLKKKAIAERMGISNYTLGMKLSGVRKFNIDEVAALCKILTISEERRNAIFFNHCVDSKATSRKEN